MSHYAQIFVDETVGYARYLWQDVTHPSASSYFYLLIAVSLAVLLLERLFPWRKAQPLDRAGFRVDVFYLFFNFFLFSLIGYNGAANVAVALFLDARRALGVGGITLVEASGWPRWAQWLLFFVVRDFIHYWIHRLLHRVPRLWRVHQVHHSVREMSFAAHLRFHPGETVVYRTLEYLPLAAIGWGLDDFFVVHALSLTIGHLNHANLRVPLGPLRYLFNSAQMHIWHHAKELPGRRAVNFGVSLSVWDYLFGTAHVPSDGRDIELGFDDVESYPTSFFGHLLAPFRRR